ncbi:MAG: transketolase family protein [candidate division KSB1 bacterium]|nr:transketolase family protein [candidate division KSB1 bacterium]MDZ7335848.1 transketolase family protein [candidate division KSB1 bacterium]MDZ7358562.1 transketolase family protein [candidate division KSB1 bacterium]MDZ7400162.1 transketolase family protein [candidate division KSB1 bacterium]
MSEQIAPRDVLGTTLIEVAQRDPDVVVLDADFHPASKLKPFKEHFPERFIEVGIAEQNMMGVAAGLSTLGFKPFVCTVAAFCSRRACDQVMVSIALPRLNVKILGVYPGIFVGLNGATHQSLEDIAIMRALAHMNVVHPSDAWELQQVLAFAAEFDQPLYVRVARDPAPRFIPQGHQFQLGRSFTLRDGNDVTLITYGELIGDTLEAAALLENRGVSARVIVMSSLKPVDTEAIVQAAEETHYIVTVDNHSVYGGLGSAVAEVVCERAPAKVKRLGLRDRFGRSGSNEAMKRKFGLTAQDIAREAMDFIHR